MYVKNRFKMYTGMQNVKKNMNPHCELQALQRLNTTYKQYTINDAHWSNAQRPETCALYQKAASTLLEQILMKE